MNEIPIIYTSRNFHYIFKENIEQIFKCFFSSDILRKIEKVEYHYELQEKKCDKHKCYSLTWSKPIRYQMVVEYDNSLDEPHYKSITKNIKEINNKTINTVLRMKYSLYNNTSDNSTFFVALVEYEKRDREYENYNKIIAIKTLTEYCLNIKFCIIRSQKSSGENLIGRW